MTIIPQLERDLSLAADRRLATNPSTAPGARGHDRRLAAGAAIAFSVVVVAVVAVVALSLHHGPASGAHTGSATVQSTRRELIRVLGVLSTPQTPAARNPRYDVPVGMVSRLSGTLARLRSRLRDPKLAAHARALLRAEIADLDRAVARFGYARLDTSLVRVIQAPYDETVGLDPVSEQIGARSSHRVEELGLSLLVPGSDPTGLSPQPVSALLAHGLNSFTYAHHANVGFVVVPNGVATVTVGPIHLALGNLVAPTRLAMPATTATVHDNVAAFRLSVPTVSPWPSVPPGQSGMSSSGAYVRETWRDPNGQVINHSTVLIAFNFIIRRPAHQTRLRRRAAPIFVPAVLLRHYAILRRPERPDMKQFLEQHGRMTGGGLGLDLAMARVATPVPGGRTKVWLIPGSAGDCVFVDVSFGGGYGSCGGLQGTPDEALLPGACDFSGGELAAGFVPDGNRTVTATLANGRTVTDPVHDNAFLLETSNSSFVNLLVRTASGTRAAVPFGSPCGLG